MTKLKVIALTVDSCDRLGSWQRDGDGWVNCACGNKHWGLNGAAGILILRGTEILLQHRAPWVHNGDTWGIQEVLVILMKALSKGHFVKRLRKLGSIHDY